MSRFLVKLAKKSSKENLGFEFLALEFVLWSVVGLWNEVSSIVSWRK